MVTLNARTMKAVSKVLFGSVLAEMPQGISVHTQLLCNPRITRGFNEIIATLQLIYTEQAVHEPWPSFKTTKALYHFTDYIQIPRVACSNIHHLAVSVLPNYLLLT